MMATVTEVASGLASGKRRSLARALSWLEDGDDRGFEASSSLHRTEPAPDGDQQSYVVGITGAPGAGKSTLTNRLITLLRARQETVAVLAIDPSSPLTGGALLGDRIRMAAHTHDPGVFIRSMATRGQLGGLSLAVPHALRLLERFGFAWIIVETVGVGQVETDIARYTDTTVVVVNPGWGDDVQASKAGLLEIADVFVVNKADHSGAKDTMLELTNARDLSAAKAWRAPVELCVAETGDNLLGVWNAVQRHRQDAASSGRLQQRRRERRILALRASLRELAIRRAEQCLAAIGPDLLEEVATGHTDPLSAARMLLDAPSSRSSEDHEHATG